jgi:hypothetical protein
MTTIEETTVSQTSIEVDSSLKPIAYAWPGGYPVFYLARQGYRNDETGELEYSQYDRSEFVCCPKCAGNTADSDIILVASDVNWEDLELYCDMCSKRIESAYAEDEG